jgi:hypothetical protein
LERETVENHTVQSDVRAIEAVKTGAVRGPVVPALLAYGAGSLVVLFGAVFGFEHLSPDRQVPSEYRDPIVAFSRIDGRHYARIASEGYGYDPNKRSTVAFFPLYPMLGGALAAVSGMRTEIALLIVSQMFLFGCFVLLHAYAAQRPDTVSLRSHLAATSLRPEGEEDEHRAQLAAHTLIAFAFWPTTFFFRMTYSESVFVFLCLLSLYGMRRGWSLLAIAVVCGLATAARPVGVALLLPFTLRLWNERLRDRFNFRSLALAFAVCAVACWGLLAYMLYQQLAFGDAMAFAKTQEHWTMREVQGGDKVMALLTLEPLWSTYVPGSGGYWGQKVPTIEPLFNLQAANPIYFLIAVGLVVYGAWRRWLNAYEVLFSFGLILIPYVTRSYEMCMASQGRFVAAVFPTYIVMGHLLSRIPSPWSALVVAPAAVLMAIYAALFAAGFVVI